MNIKMIVYVDGVWDMFHVGHLACLKQAHRYAKTLHQDARLVVGIVSDVDAASYKRMPIISEKDRASIILSLACVDGVIENCPLVLTKEFLIENSISIVVHGFANSKDRETQRVFFQDIQSQFHELPYTHGISTTEIINRAKKCT